MSYLHEVTPICRTESGVYLKETDIILKETGVRLKESIIYLKVADIFRKSSASFRKASASCLPVSVSYRKVIAICLTVYSRYCKVIVIFRKVTTIFRCLAGCSEKGRPESGMARSVPHFSDSFRTMTLSRACSSFSQKAMASSRRRIGGRAAGRVKARSFTQSFSVVTNSSA